MVIYETRLELRSVHSFDLYNFHQATENFMVSVNKINTHYSFFVERALGGKDAVVVIRSIEPVDHYSCTKIDVEFVEGEEVVFLTHLHTSENKKITTNGKVKQREIPCDTEDKRIIKLLNIAEKNGFDANCVSEVDFKVHSLTKKGSRFSLAGSSLLVNAVVTDVAAFKRAYLTGIGRKKNLGFGMMVML